ncbi:hypothetical protein ACFORJ_00830 [Corynebacterium hansenii]|uniref:Para-aminobenzoate synthase n=1 Tax=Corynebacterium hansenii TaxID=394964 RepID=A0ABV7ZNJ8_9CORY|nr:hypothetical protein [Corynebacterium hansenii]WJY99454.1 hypothetical protein CHAN_04155 [Corynebacterium hansenii]
MILLIDGRSGSGKTTFAEKLRGVLGWPVVHLEDAYPGWGGLAAASGAVAESMLDPDAAGFRRWDWFASDWAEWVDLSGHMAPGRSLIIEGCGALTAANLAAARAIGDGEAWGAWVELDEPTRFARAMARDPYFRGHWRMWAEQEDAHIARHDPRALADWTVRPR